MENQENNKQIMRTSLYLAKDMGTSILTSWNFFKFFIKECFLRTAEIILYVLKELKSAKMIMAVSLFILYAYTIVKSKDPVIVVSVAGVFTITINYLYRIRADEKKSTNILDNKGGTNG